MPSCSVCSEAETEPQGYSAPTPMPSKNLIITFRFSDKLLRTKYLQAHNISSIPLTLLFEPVDAADNTEKRATIAVADIFTESSDYTIHFSVWRTILNLHPSLSEIHPNKSMPMTVPFKDGVWGVIAFFVNHLTSESNTGKGVAIVGPMERSRRIYALQD